jgi:hypothetical protein
MKAQSPSSADMRAFRWHLAPLERKLEATIEAARLARAVLQRQAEALKLTIEALADQRRTEIKSAAVACNEAIDPRAHARVLKYLVQVSGTIESKHAEAADLDRRIQGARQDGLDSERQLACVVRMREAAQAAYAQDQFRAVAKESDLAWLALRANEDRSGGFEGAGA